MSDMEYALYTEPRDSELVMTVISGMRKYPHDLHSIGCTTAGSSLDCNVDTCA
jgi:hypothetical protein